MDRFAPRRGGLCTYLAAMTRLLDHGGMVDAGTFAAHGRPEGTPQHVREALWVFSGWVPVAAIADCVALTSHAAAEIMRNVPRVFEVRTAGGGCWTRGANDHDWYLVCLNRCIDTQRGVDVVLDEYAQDPDKYGNVAAAPEGRRSAPSRNVEDGAGRGSAGVVLVDLAPERDGL